MKSLMFLFSFLFCLLSWAQSPKAVTPKKTVDASFEQLRIDQPTSNFEQIQRVRQRSYPGGAFESDLKVQATLPTPSRKMAPVTELKAKEEQEAREE